MLTSVKNKLRRLLAMVISVFLVAGVVMPVEAKALESPYDSGPLAAHLEDAYAFGYGGLLDLRLLNEWVQLQDGTNLSAVDLPGVDQLWETSAVNDQLAKRAAVNVELLKLIYLNLGDIQIPLLGQDTLLHPLISDINVGLLNEYAHAPLATSAHGAAGVLSDMGGIGVTPPGTGKSAEINILSLLHLQDSPAITNTIISRAALELGAISAVARKPDATEPGENTALTCAPDESLFAYASLGESDLHGDPAVLMEEDGRICSGYQIADATLVVDSPLVEDLTATLQSALNDVLRTAKSTVNGLLGTESILAGVYDIPVAGDLLGDLVRLSVEIDLPTAEGASMSITDTLLGKKLTSSDELITIDLASGEIRIDLHKLQTGGLNNRAPNTSLLTSTEIGQITNSLANLLTKGKEEEPYGLNALLDEVLRGTDQRGGLYATEVSIQVCLLEGALGCNFLTGAEITTTLGGLLNPDATQTSLSWLYKGNPYDYYLVTGLVGMTLGGLLFPIMGAVGGLVEDLLFGSPSLINPTGETGAVFGGLQTVVIQPLLDGLNPLLEAILAPIARITVNRQTLQQVANGSVFTVSALELSVLNVNSPGEVIHLPLATASVMAQRTRLIDLNLDVAKIGDGRGLHTGGYTYNLTCEAEDGWALAEEDLSYDQLNVGSGFSFADNQLHLTGATGGLADPLRVKPGAECTVTANPAPAGHDALLPTPTGEDPTAARTPYTYFLDTDETGVLVSGETPTGQPTTMTSTGVTWPDDQVQVDATNVGAEWKTHSFTFEVPTDATSHNVNIVHSYDIDKRNIVVTKNVDDKGEVFRDEAYAFQYSLDGGTTWLPEEPAAPLTIGDEEAFMIEDVPVLTENTSGVLAPTPVLVREALGNRPEGPIVSWIVKETTEATESAPLVSDYTTHPEYATASFTTGPIATVPTPAQQLGVTNYYAKTSVDKHIDGLFAAPGTDTTLLPAGQDTIEITYTVTPVAGVPPTSITLSDPSLYNNPLFSVEGEVTVSETGEISGCDFVDTLTCTITVRLTNPDDPFHYNADDAMVTATVLTTIDGREVTATATDRHGAMRLPGILGQLPATGVTTLVWVMALGLIAALTALALYVRSRRK